MVPEWASFFTPQRFQAFLDRLHAVLQERGEAFHVDVEAGLWRYESDGRSFGLINLAQICNQDPEEEWEGTMRHFIDLAINRSATQIPTDIESLRPLLRVRLYSAAYANEAPTVKVPLAEGLVICLTVDFPDLVKTLSRDIAVTLGLSSEELFDIGLANVQATVEAERSDREFGNGGKIVSLAGDSFFTTSLALTLDEHAAPEPEHGFIVAVPNRHEVLAIPIESGRSFGVLPALVTVARNMFEAGPGSLSPYVYWVRRRRWARIELEESERGVGVIGPDPFVEEVVRPLLRP